MIDRFFCLLCGILFLTWSCVPADYTGRAAGTGIGGTGSLARQGAGIGGTGQFAATGSGIGGTGALVGQDGDRLGIIGRITGFGSIWVNGLEVELDRLALESASDIDPSAGLAKGQVVEVVAERTSGRWQAESVRVRYEVGGPVGSLSADGKEMTILGQQVLIAADTVLPESWPTVKSGSVIRVSGFRLGGNTVLASRVDFARADAPALLIGRVGKTAAKITVSGTPVQLPADAPALRGGDILRVRGAFDNNTLRADTVERDRATLFAATVDRFQIQAMAVRDASGVLRLGGMPFRLPHSFASGDRPQARPLLFIGNMTGGGEFRLQRVAPSPVMPGPDGVRMPSMSAPPAKPRHPGPVAGPFSRPPGAMGGRGGRPAR